MKAVNEQTAILVQKLYRDGITSEKILEAFASVDRKDFVAGAFASRAYEDIALPITAGQTISQPKVVALSTQLLQIKAHHRILEVGTGSGYHALILSHLARHVYTVERYRSLADSALKLIVEKYKRQNVSVVHADGSFGLPSAAPFDRILVTAASEDVPPVLLNQLKTGGIMVIPLGTTHDQQLYKIEKKDSETKYEDIADVRFVPLLEGVKDE